MEAPDNTTMLRRADDRHRLWLAVLVVAWGIQAIVAQSLLLREALVLMFGSEFAWGVVLFAWLLGVAIGAWVGGWLARRIGRSDVGLVVVVLTLSIAACVELWVFRSARAWLAIEPGEMLPLVTTALAATVFVSPAGALVGMAFPVAVSITPPAESQNDPSSEPRTSTRPGSPGESPPQMRGSLQLGTIYALESAGSLIGGAAFSFWAVENLSPIQTALCCVLLIAAVSAGLLFTGDRRRYGLTVPAGIALGTLITLAFAGRTLDQKLVLRRWADIAPGYDLRAEAETKYQNLAIGQRAGQYTLYSNGKVASDFPDPYTFVPLAHFWLCQHPSPRNVLVLGGGAEGLLVEILRHPIEHVDYIEPDPRLIELIRPYLSDADRAALTDPRVSIHGVDARYFVKTQSSRYDLVIARLPEPTSALCARLYTDEFYSELRGSMTPQSALCTTAVANPGRLSKPFAEYLASIRATLHGHFPAVTISWGNPAHVLAATQGGLTTSAPAELTRRYAQRNVDVEWFDPAWFDGATDWLATDKLRLRKTELDDVNAPEMSTDLRPCIYMQRLAIWESATGAGGSRETGVIEQLRAVGWAQLITVLFAIGGVTLLWCYIRQRTQARRARAHRNTAMPAGWFSQGAIVLSIGTTGFVTMALSIIWLFAFQNLYGYVYQRIGWIIALFMGGLVIGCGLVGWLGRHAKAGPAVMECAGKISRPSLRFWSSLILVDGLLALLALSIPFILPALSELQSTPLALSIVEWSVSLLVAVTGILGGAAFALAAGLQTRLSDHASAAAGTIVGADHAGACLGALMCGILLVPVFGTAAAAYLLGVIKLVSAALLAAGKPASPLVPCQVEPVSQD